jgi:serine phosphatase RsbU (regulator of sigma subunit)
LLAIQVTDDNASGSDSPPAFWLIVCVKTSPTNPLKLYDGPSSPQAPVGDQGSAVWEQLCEAFAATTGWSMRLTEQPTSETTSSRPTSAPDNPGVGAALRRGALELSPLGVNRVRRAAVEKLGESLALLVENLTATRRALGQREAELAAGVPITVRADRATGLADRLASVLRGGAGAIGCQAAALYMLDEATSQLKLRCAWGLPADRLTAPARSLALATADLEALCGHAVVLSSGELGEYWNAPEKFPAAICVPVATDETQLGTLWFFCDRQRDFNDRETNVAEIVAGRLAADLEREMLLAESVGAADARRQLQTLDSWRREQASVRPPAVDGWDVAGTLVQTDRLGGAFFDFPYFDERRMAVCVGSAAARDLEAALVSTTLRTAVRAHAARCRAPGRLLAAASETLWTASTGAVAAGLFAANVDPQTGRVRYASGGSPGGIVVRRGGSQKIASSAMALGVGSNATYRARSVKLEPGEAMILVSDGAARWIKTADARRFADAVRPMLDESADQIVATAERLFAETAATDSADRSILVVRRKPIAPRTGRRLP